MHVEDLEGYQKALVGKHVVGFDNCPLKTQEDDGLYIIEFTLDAYANVVLNQRQFVCKIAELRTCSKPYFVVRNQQCCSSVCLVSSFGMNNLQMKAERWEEETYYQKLNYYCSSTKTLPWCDETMWIFAIYYSKYVDNARTAK